MTRRAIRAVLLDLDDTITDRQATVRAYASRFLQDFGARFELSDPVQVGAELARIDRNGYNPGRASELAAHAAWRQSPGPELLAAHWSDHFVRCTQGRAQLVPTLDALASAGLRLGVVTNGPTHGQRRKIEVLGLQQRLAAVLISEELGIAKPDERIFHAAAQALGVELEACMFIGDNPLKDVCAAAALGMRAVWFRATLPWPEDLAQPAETIGSFPEVLRLLDHTGLLPNAKRLLS
jgi:putative hydrolase of the HAD superfamily